MEIVSLCWKEGEGWIGDTNQPVAKKILSSSSLLEIPVLRSLKSKKLRKSAIVAAFARSALPGRLSLDKMLASGAVFPKMSVER